MCGRYHLGDEDKPEGLRKIISTLNRRDHLEDVKTTGEVFPSDVAPVIASSRARRPAVFAMPWGYAMPDGRRVINARSETAANRPMFREGMAARRCAVPASCYFEWEHNGSGRTKYAVSSIGSDMIYMAGLYRLRDGRPEFVILTRAPADPIAFIHDRMPVLLPETLVGAWIDPDSAPAPILEHAVTAVAFEKQTTGQEQLRIEI